MTRSDFGGGLVATAVFFAAITAASAQGQDQGAPSSRNPPQAQTAVPPGPSGGTDGSGSSTNSLSGELSRSHGVIRPPATGDRGMTQSPPAVGSESTPVIPPPGTPGGNPNVQPK